jgi:hypothetical protein
MQRCRGACHAVAVLLMLAAAAASRAVSVCAVCCLSSAATAAVRACCCVQQTAPASCQNTQQLDERWAERAIARCRLHRAPLLSARDHVRAEHTAMAATDAQTASSSARRPTATAARVTRKRRRRRRRRSRTGPVTVARTSSQMTQPSRQCISATDAASACQPSADAPRARSSLTLHAWWRTRREATHRHRPRRSSRAYCLCRIVCIASIVSHRLE